MDRGRYCDTCYSVVEPEEINNQTGLKLTNSERNLLDKVLSFTLNEGSFLDYLEREGAFSTNGILEQVRTIKSALTDQD